jgi:hypothetical protein
MSLHLTIKTTEGSRILTELFPDKIVTGIHAVDLVGDSAQFTA